jgi:integrase
VSNPVSPKRRPRRSFGKIHQERSGKFQASYIGPDGVRHNAPTTFETRGDASAFLSLMQSKIIQGKWKPVPENVGREALTFAAYANPWLADRDLKPRTRALYRGLLDRRILPALGSKPVPSLTPADIRGWHAGQPADQPTARAHAYALLRTILSSAVLDGLLPANPCHIRGASGTTRRHRIEPASMPQLEVILDNMPEQYRLMILLASWCALRFGELTELRRGDLDLSHTRVKVTRGVTWIDGKPTIGAPKSTAGICDVGIPPHLVPAVRRHLQDHVGWGKDTLLFSTANGEQIGRGGAFQKHWERARKAAGRDDLRFHDLRHTGAVMAAQSGATIAELMGRLGHTTPAMAIRYQHVAEGRDDEIARRMSEMIKVTQ